MLVLQATAGLLCMGATVLLCLIIKTGQKRKRRERRLLRAQLTQFDTSRAQSPSSIAYSLDDYASSRSFAPALRNFAPPDSPRAYPKRPIPPRPSHLPLTVSGWPGHEQPGLRRAHQKLAYESANLATAAAAAAATTLASASTANTLGESLSVNGGNGSGVNHDDGKDWGTPYMSYMTDRHDETITADLFSQD